MTDRDSHNYMKLIRMCKRHLQWIGLSEASRDILATLLVETYWSGQALSPEELATLTGYSRGSISVAISQLRSLGFIETRVDSSHIGRGRRPTQYILVEGLSGLVNFGVRRLSVELEGLLAELEAFRVGLDSTDAQAHAALVALESEASRNLEELRKQARKILSTKAASLIEPPKRKKK